MSESVYSNAVVGGLDDGLQTMSDRIAEACRKCGEKRIDGIPLENPNPGMLDLSEYSIDEHLATQPAAIAYYGSLLKKAERDFKELEQEFNLLLNKWCADIRQQISGSLPKVVRSEIEAIAIRSHETEYKKLIAELNNAREILDNMSVWYEAWHDKGFRFREFAKVTEDERRSSYGNSDSLS